MSEVIDDRDAQGRFLPGNRYMAPRWVKGQSGKPARYTPRKLEHALTEYVNHCFDLGVPLARAALAAHLGMTTPGYMCYLKGEIGKTEDDRAGCTFVLERFETLLEAQIELGLGSKEYSTTGLIFKAKNLFPGRWTDTKHLNVDTQGDQQVIMMLPPDLAQTLAERRGETIEAIDTTYKVIQDEVT